MISTASVTLLVFTSVCAVSDLLTRKVPNTLILCGMLCAVISRTCLCLSACSLRLFSGSLADMTAGFLLPYLLLGPLALLKMLGGGDVKMLSVIGLQTGWRGSLRMMWYSLLFAALLSALIVVRRGNLVQRLEYLRRYLEQCLTQGSAGPYRDMDEDASGTGEFAFAVPVFLALILYLTEQTFLYTF